MSIESLAIALHHSRAAGTAKLVLLGIANHDGDGGSWPSVATLARYANVDRRNVQRSLQKLVELREIAVEVQSGGVTHSKDHERPNLYHFTLTCPIDCDRSKNHRTKRGRQPGNMQLEGLTASSPQGAATAPPGGDSAARGAATAPPKPSSKPLATDERTTYVPERAREAICETTGQPHRINRKLRYCADCLTPTALLEAPNRKEGAA